jgi:hypothetical protein
LVLMLAATPYATSTAAKVHKPSESQSIHTPTWGR